MILEINYSSLTSVVRPCAMWFYLLLVVIVSCLLISIPLAHETQMVCISQILLLLKMPM